MKILTKLETAAFWIRVQKTNGCWLWLGGTQEPKKPGRRKDRGYGLFYRHGKHGTRKRLYVHRLSWILNAGKPPRKGKQILHRCNVKLCVRPDHLYEGTTLENMLDRVAAARAEGRDYRMYHKLSPNNIREIKRLLSKTQMTQKTLGERFGVTREAISKIHTGKNWGTII